MSRTTLYLIRHGSTDYNLRGIFQGRRDVPLNSTGRLQARLLARRMENIPLARVYTSTLSRAKETADILLWGRSGTPLLPMEALREIDGGRMEGRTAAQNRELFPEAVRALDTAPAFYQAPGGESMRQMYDRTLAAMEDIWRESRGRAAAVVTHGCNIQCCLYSLTGRPFEELDQKVPGNASVTCLQREGDAVRLVYAGGEEHLPRELRVDFHQVFFSGAR